MSSRSARQAFNRAICAPLCRFVDRHERAVAGGQRRDLGFLVRIDADPDFVAALDSLDPRRIGGDQALLHVFQRFLRRGAAELGDALHLLADLDFELRHLLADHLGAVEDVFVFQHVGLEGADLLQPQRPLLVPGARQAERLVPRRQLHGAGARVLGQGHAQHAEQHAVDVVLRLLLGQAEGIDLHAIAEQAQLGVGHAVTDAP
ncbi:MAG: hypothetical protein WDM81_16795 [Rhizomicrobium sp.]